MAFNFIFFIYSLEVYDSKGTKEDRKLENLSTLYFWEQFLCFAGPYVISDNNLHVQGSESTALC